MQNCKPKLLTLCLLMSFPMVGAVTFTPALAQLLDDFGVSTSMSQMTVAMYLGGYALGQLPYGWLTNRYGHKPAVYIGLCIFVLGSLVCAASPTIGFLMAGRAIMAIGAAVGLMMTFALVSQFYTVKEARAIFAYTTLSMAIIPGLASAIGGMLTGYLGWRSCFCFLIFYAGVVGFFASRLPKDEIGEERIAFSLKSYVELVTNMRFVTLALMAAMTSAVIYVFAATAPLTAVYLLEVAPQIYGLISFVPFIGTVGGCLLSASLSEKLSARKAIVMGLFLSLGGAALKLGLVQGFGLHVWTIFVPMPFIYFGMPFVYANGAAISLAMARNKSVGSSIFCLGNVGLSLLGVLVMGWMGVSSLTRMPIVFLVMLSIMSAFFVVNFLLGKDDATVTPQVSES